MTDRTTLLCDAVADAVTSVAGVVGLHAGMFGEVATYLPGRKVPGIRLGESGTEVHVALALGAPLHETAEQVRSAVAALVDGPIHVTIENVVES